MRTSSTRGTVFGVLFTGTLAQAAAAGGLSGTIRDARTGQPVTNIAVRAYNPNGVEVCFRWTGAGGVYSCDGLSAGSYYVRTAAWPWSLPGHLDQLWHGIPCPLESCQVTSGTPVHVTAHATTTGIDFSLAPGGGIGGTVWGAATGPLSGVVVKIYTATGSWAANAYTDNFGDYTSPTVLPTGSYFARTENSLGYFDEVYADVSCVSWGCTVTSGRPIGVTAGATTPWIDFGLSPGGRIRATVTDGLTGQPLSDVDVRVYDWRGHWVTNGRTDGSGAFTTAEGLPTGTYYAKTSNSVGYVDELYDDVPCMGSCTVTQGAPIRVTAGATSFISFALRPGGRISGHVTLDGAIPPVEASPASVQIYDTAGRPVAFAQVDATGGYTTDGGLATGTYYARASASHYLSELYERIPCPTGECPVTGGTPIAVTAEATTAGVDFDLPPGSRISGTVTDSETGLPLAGVDVLVYDSGGAEVTSADTASDGRYTTPAAMAPGTYYARAGTDGYLDELYDDVPCPHHGEARAGGSTSWMGFCPVSLGTPIVVSAATPTTGIDFALTPSGAISGTVTDAASGLPLAGAGVAIWDAAELRGLSAAWAQTDSSGHYSATLLGTGTYYATTSFAGHVAELYDDVPCPDACPVTAGTPISVTAGATTRGVDFALEVGGGISGTVRDAATGLPVAGVEVSLYGSDGWPVPSGRTDVSGAYVTDAVHGSGTYFARTSNHLGYVDELYDDVACPACETVTKGTPVRVRAGATTGGVDFSLAAMGRIAGTVSDAATGRPLPGVRVEIFGSDGGLAMAASVANDGTWATGVALVPGAYYARTSNDLGYVEELYDGIACPYATCPVTSGRAIVVRAAATTRGVGFRLTRGGRIGGRVTAASGLPLAYVDVQVYDGEGALVATGLTNALGDYATTGGPALATGTYFVRTSNALGYVDALWAGIPCPGESCSVTTGTPVRVTTGATTNGIDFVLAPGGRISSFVRDAATGQPLEGVEVSIHDGSGRRLTGGSTDGWGQFTSDAALVSGNYYARTSNTLGYADELYDDVPCPRGACAVTGGTPIGVTAGNPAPRIVFALAFGGGIAGHATDAGTGQPVAGAKVRVCDSSGLLVRSGTTDAAGSWSSSAGLQNGTYYARTESAPGYLDELYDDVPCALGVCTVTSGTPIDVTAGRTTTGVDFSLEPSPGTSFYTVAPCRLLDTRDPGGPTSGQPLAAGDERTFTVVGGCGIPATAKAVALNVTTTEARQPGNVRLYPAGAPAPSTSNVNYTPGVTRAGNAIVSLNASAEFAVLASPAGTVHLVLDFSGYYE